MVEKDGGVHGGGGQGSPQLTRTGGESPLVSGWWRKNWIKTCCHIPDGMYAKMIQIKKKQQQ